MPDRVQPSEPLLLTVAQVARRLQIAHNRAHELITSGQLPGVRIGRSLRVPVQALHRWVDGLTMNGPEPAEPSSL